MFQEFSSCFGRVLESLRVSYEGSQNDFRISDRDFKLVLVGFCGFQRGLRDVPESPMRGGGELLDMVSQGFSGLQEI